MCACVGQRPCSCVPGATTDACLKCEPVRGLKPHSFGAGSIWIPVPICFHNILVGQLSCFCLCPVEMRGPLCRQPASLQSWLLGTTSRAGESSSFQRASERFQLQEI